MSIALGKLGPEMPKMPTVSNPSRSPLPRRPTALPTGPRLFRATEKNTIYRGGPGIAPPDFKRASTSASEWIWYWASMKVLDPDRDPRQPPFYGGRLWDYQCFHPETELLTVGGWKQVGDIEPGEIVATMNPDDREMTYSTVSATQSYFYDGDLVAAYQERGVSVAVTPNHTMLASFGKQGMLQEIRASNLLDAGGKIPRIPQWANWSSGMSAPGRTFSARTRGKDIVFSGPDFASFMGWYVAEGSASYCSGRYEITISQVNETGRTIIRELLSRIGGNVHEGERAFTINSRSLFEYLLPLGKSNDKHVPDEIRFWDRPSIQLFLDALVEGDGTWINDTGFHNNGHLVTSSKRLVDDVCELATKAGYRATYCIQQGNHPDSPFGTKPRWHVSLWRMSHDTQVRGWHEEPYYGPVYCVTVPPFHTVLTRLNNRVSWSGQSPELGAFTRSLGSAVVDFLYKLSYPYLVVRIQTFRFHLATTSLKQAYDRNQRVKLAGKFATIDVYEQDYIRDRTGSTAILLLRDTLGMAQRPGPLTAGTTYLARNAITG